MDELNNTQPDITAEEITSEVENMRHSMKSQLLIKERQKYSLLGGVSIIFGIIFVACFYKADLGINFVVFTGIVIGLLSQIMKRLNFVIKQTTMACYLGAFSLSISTFLTASEVIQFINIIGILLLLDISLLHQFNDDKNWDFGTHIMRVLGLLIQSIACIGMPFSDSYRFIGKVNPLKNERLKNIVIGLCIAIPLLWIIVMLLSSADLLFGELLSKIFNFSIAPDVFGIGMMLMIGFITCYCIICGSISRVNDVEKVNINKKADSTIAITTISSLCLVYVVFCVIQLLYLFANGFLTLPQTYTFAEYARRGFFELLFVTILNIVLIIISTMLFKESKLLRIMLTIMTVCTYIMMASATYRMLLYIGAYHLTFLRLFVLLFLFIDALVLAGVIFLVFHNQFPLFRYCVVVISTCYIAFSLSRPDYYIASYYVSHQEVLDNEDLLFLTQELSLDAAPIVLPLLSYAEDYNRAEISTSWEYREKHRIDYYALISQEKRSRTVRDFNLSIYLASHYAHKYPLE